MDKSRKKSADRPLPLSEHQEAIRGLLGTPKDEVDEEERQDRKRRKHKHRQSKPGPKP